jgi:hypothetical protein
VVAKKVRAGLRMPSGRAFGAGIAIASGRGLKPGSFP